MVLVSFHELAFVFDDKPETNPSWLIIFGAVSTFYALWRARDNTTSDEQAGTRGSTPKDD